MLQHGGNTDSGSVCEKADFDGIDKYAYILSSILMMSIVHCS